MVLQVVAITKLKLLATAAHGHGAGQLLAALLGPFILKVPFSRYGGAHAIGDIVVSARLFFFQLSRILFQDRPAVAGTGRWNRALRLVSGMPADGGRRLGAAPPDEGSLHVVSMILL